MCTYLCVSKNSGITATVATLLQYSMCCSYMSALEHFLGAAHVTYVHDSVRWWQEYPCLWALTVGARGKSFLSSDLEGSLAFWKMLWLKIKFNPWIAASGSQISGSASGERIEICACDCCCNRRNPAPLQRTTSKEPTLSTWSRERKEGKLTLAPRAKRFMLSISSPQMFLNLRGMWQVVPL
jgi:hypothetical protein